MEFVKPETVRINLNGAGHWIDIKKELSVAEEEWLLTAGYRRKDGEVVVDWVMMKLAPVLAYLVDWSAKTAVSETAIRTLRKSSFEEIADAIKAHRDSFEEEKKLPIGDASDMTEPLA